MSKSLADEIVDYEVTKQRIIERMNKGPAPSQETEMFIADQMIMNAIISARGFLIKISCVNQESFLAGVEKGESNG